MSDCNGPELVSAARAVAKQTNSNEPTHGKGTTVKALLLREYRRLELTDLPKPAIGNADVLVKVKGCGICGSDVYAYDGSRGRRISPVVMGHEGCRPSSRPQRAYLLGTPLAGPPTPSG